MRRFPTLFLVLALVMPAIAGKPATTVNLSLNVSQPGVTNPVCVRAIIRKSDGTYLDDAWFPTSFPNVAMHGKAMAPGVSVQVPTGTTRITVGKGPDYIPQTIITNLDSHVASSFTINVTLQPALDLYEQGWRIGEMHLHYIHGEQEILRTPQQVWAICAAGGLNFVSFCEEHYGAGTMTRQQMYDQWVPYQSTECQLYMGLEEPKNAWGHHANIVHDPWLIRSSLPYWVGIHSVHEQGGVNYPVHPARLFPSRFDASGGVTNWFFYPYNNFSKCYPLDSLMGHLMDGWSGVSDEANNSVILPPYFRLMAMGYRVPLLADSDLCMDRINNGGKGSGCWSTFYNLEGRPVSPASIAEAMHRGRVMSTTGPLVLFTIDNAMSGDTLPADGSTHTVNIQASYTFNPWTLTNSTFNGSDITRITEIDLYRNGQILQSWTPNTPTASVQRTINESTPNSYYMVRVVGNEGSWMAGYASPIYFDNAPRPRQPPGFKSLIQGRLYDSASGLALTGTVSCVRYAKTNWAIPTDSQGRFQVYAPLDAQLVAQDQAGRTLSRNILQQESVYAFCNNMADNYASNQGASIDALSNIVRQMTWEFPIGYQLAASYVRTNLTNDAVMTNFSIVSAPPFTPGKTTSEIAMLLVDKTQVQPGDTVNYAVIYRSPNQPPTDQFVVEWRGWDTNHPQIFTKYNLEFVDNNSSATLINLGNGFYLRQSSMVVPPWAANVTDSTAAIQMFVTVRPPGRIAEEAQLLLRVGPTQRGLLVSSTSDGLPASWGEIGIGPCNFRRDFSDFQVRYSDYRNMVVNLTLNGQPITLNPKVDTAHAADADDAVFNDLFFYDGQCEPQFRNVPFRDPVRTQPPPADFSSVPIQNAPDTTPPNVVAIEPPNGRTVPAGTNLFYFLVDDEGLSGPSSATIYIDGSPVMSTSTNPVALNLAAGTHTWQVKGFDVAGNFAFSSLNSFTVTGSGSTNPPPINTVWVDDALPAGASPAADGGDSWNWVGSDPTPLSGTFANQSSIAPGEHEHLFTNATATLPVSSNDTLFAYIYLDPANVPAEVMLQWNDGSWEHRAFWGTNVIALGTTGTESRRDMGALPPSGQWSKLSVPAQQVGLTNSILNGLALTLYGGRATWDYIGKSSGAFTNPPPSPGTIFGSLTNGPWQVQVTNPGTWLYSLERSTNLQDWTPLSSTISTGGPSLLFEDTNPPSPDGFYRVHVQLP